MAIVAAAVRGLGRFSAASAAWLSHPLAFALAVASVLAWGAAGPACAWSETWLMVGNTYMSVVSFLALFLILVASLRESTALHAKLDEIVVAVPDARNELVASEGLPVERIAELRASLPAVGAGGSDNSALG